MQRIEQQLFALWFSALVDNYESPGRNIWTTISCSAEDAKSVREFLASQVAQGLLKRNASDRYRLTHHGYLKYAPKVKALPTMTYL